MYGLFLQNNSFVHSLLAQRVDEERARPDDFGNRVLWGYRLIVVDGGLYQKSQKYGIIAY